jgi:hypothetical protein
VPAEIAEAHAVGPGEFDINVELEQEGGGVSAPSSLHLFADATLWRDCLKASLHCL